METDSRGISLIIRTWNEVTHIQQALDAAIEQTTPPDEIIVVDSGSTDGTLDKLSGFEVKLLTIPHEDFTYGYAWNTGARSAKGDYLVSLSAHALPVNRIWLNNLLKPLQSDPTIAGVSSHQISFLNQSIEPYLVLWQTLYRWGLRTPTVRRYLFSNVCSAIRSALWRENPFDESIATCEDHLWALQMQRQGYSIAYASDSYLYHSHHLSARAGMRRRWGELRALLGLYTSHPDILKRGEL